MKAQKTEEKVISPTIIPPLNDDSSIIDEAIIVFKYNDFTGEFDMSDLDSQKLYRESANIISESMEAMTEQIADENLSETERSDILTKGKYEMYVNYFNAIFHEHDNAGKQIIGEKINSRNAIIAFATFTRFLQNQQIAKAYEMTDVLQELAVDGNKYNPNRATRRKNK